MDKVMTAAKLIEMCQKACELPSVYATGCFGWPLNYGDNLERIIAEWPNNQKPKHEAVIRERAALAKKTGDEVFGWDCINLIKSVLWSWAGDPHQEYGGAVYCSNGVPDVTVYDFFNDCCTDQSTDFDNIIPGEMLYYGNGSHCGVYIGDGLAIEATGSWDRTCTVSIVMNVIDRFPDTKTNGRERTWQAHGKIKFVEYEEDEPVTNTIICPCCGATLNAQLTLTPAEDLLDIYTVKTGDSPWSIAVKYYGDGTKYTVIMDYNNLPRNSYIYTGQQLKIPRI